jgi:hypothetical protein
MDNRCSDTAREGAVPHVQVHRTGRVDEGPAARQIRGLMQGWPAMVKWATPAVVARHYGGMQVLKDPPGSPPPPRGIPPHARGQARPDFTDVTREGAFLRPSCPLMRGASGGRARAGDGRAGRADGAVRAGGVGPQGGGRGAHASGGPRRRPTVPSEGPP